MADITHLPTPAFATSDDLTVRATASLQAMHDRVLAEGGIDPFTHAILMLIRAIIAYLAIPLDPITAAQPAPAPDATTRSIRQRTHAPRARQRTSAPRAQQRTSALCATSVVTQALRTMRESVRTRRSHPTPHHQSTQPHAGIIRRAPLLPDLPKPA